MNRHIYVDIGNSNTKWKIKDSYFQESTANFSIENLPTSSKIWVSNVTSSIFDDIPNVMVFEAQKQYKSLVSSYNEPNLLGSDRWFAMIAAYEYSVGNSFIMVDIGTAVTIDVVNKRGQHEGGLIFPGIKKIRETFQFPVTREFKNINSFAQSTENAWSLGTMNLVVNLIDTKVQECKQKFSNLKVFLTGGGYLEIKNFLNFHHEYHRNLVLDGLEFHVDNMR